MLGKTLAEEAAWKFSEENRVNMVAINLGMVIGPLLQPTLNASVKPILNLVKGTFDQPAARILFISIHTCEHILKYAILFCDASYGGLFNAGVKIPCETYGWVDVRDVAKAHIQAFENPTACGRYCLVERVVNHFGIFKILRGLYPHLNPPEE